MLLLDEPLSNLDAKLRHDVRLEIRQLQRELGLTTVFVTHDQEEALTVADRLVVMNQGVIAQVGTPRELYDRPRSAFVADFIGKSNFFEGEVAGPGCSAPAPDSISVSSATHPVAVCWRCARSACRCCAGDDGHTQRLGVAKVVTFLGPTTEMM